MGNNTTSNCFGDPTFVKSIDWPCLNYYQTINKLLNFKVICLQQNQNEYLDIAIESKRLGINYENNLLLT